MSNLNKIILVGKVTDDLQLKNSQEGTALAAYVLAVERPQRADGTAGETDFIEVVSWARQAEQAVAQFKKGSTVLVEGRIQVRTINEDNGKRKWITEVVTSNLVCLDGKQGNILAPSESAEQQEPTTPVAAMEDIPF
ncbi:single-stranded DNA-binding protein [Candidatus Margulisiibacteriota bacterium]